MSNAKSCPLHGCSTPAEEARAYQALQLCELDGDEHTTAAILECLEIGYPAPAAAAAVAEPRGDRELREDHCRKATT